MWFVAAGGLMLSCLKHTVEEDSRSPATVRIWVCIRICWAQGREPWASSLCLLAMGPGSEQSSRWVGCCLWHPDFSPVDFILEKPRWLVSEVFFSEVSSAFVICKSTHRYPSFKITVKSRNWKPHYQHTSLQEDKACRTIQYIPCCWQILCRKGEIIFILWVA